MRRGKGETPKEKLQCAGGNVEKRVTHCQGNEGGKNEQTVFRVIPELDSSEAPGSTSLKVHLGRRPFFFNSRLFSGVMIDVQGSV